MYKYMWKSGAKILLISEYRIGSIHWENHRQRRVCAVVEKYKNVQKRLRNEQRRESKLSTKKEHLRSQTNSVHLKECGPIRPRSVCNVSTEIQLRVISAAFSSDL